jgi:uncharacterized protein (TIGR03000 family)
MVLLMALSGSGEMPVACHRGGGGRGGHAGRRHGGGRRGGGCGYGGGCGSGYGGGCGSGGCGHGGGYAVGCSSCGGGYMGYASVGGGCPGGICAIDGTGSALLAEAAGAPATIVVDLPEDATLTVDDSATRATSATRVFVSPSLSTGQDFHYTLKAEVMRDGKPFSVEKTITVRAGVETRVSLEMPHATVVSREP